MGKFSLLAIEVVEKANDIDEALEGIRTLRASVIEKIRENTMEYLGLHGL